jgi:hypothetical protein
MSTGIAWYINARLGRFHTMRQLVRVVTAVAVMMVIVMLGSALPRVPALWRTRHPAAGYGLADETSATYPAVWRLKCPHHPPADRASHPGGFAHERADAGERPSGTIGLARSPRERSGTQAMLLRLEMVVPPAPGVGPLRS